MEQVRIFGKLKQLPTSWGEVPKKQLSTLIGLFYQNMEETELRVAAVLLLLKIPAWQRGMLPMDAMYIMVEKMGWLLRSHPSVDKNHFPEMGGLLGTDDVLGGFRLWEFALTEQAFRQWAEKPTGEGLDLFLAHWYRKKLSPSQLKRRMKKDDWDGDKRRFFIETEIEKNAKRLRKVPFTQKLLVAHFFANELARIAEGHPHVYSGDKNRTDREYTWADTIIAISPINREDETARNRLATILRRMENENRAHAEAKGQDGR